MKTATFKYLFVFFLAIISLAMECNKEEENELPEGLFAYFTVEPETGLVNTLFTFNAQLTFWGDPNTGNPSGHVLTQWDFDYRGDDDIVWDTEFSYEDIVTHTYTEAGTYTILLGAKYDRGNDVFSEYTEEMTRTVVVTEGENTNPVALISITTEEGYPMLTYSLNAHLSWDNEDPSDSLKVRWDWENDGTYDTEFTKEKYANHFYIQDGDYTVKLQVKDTKGFTGESTESLTVNGPGGEPCGGQKTVVYGNKTYNTVQIGTQCWMKENLNIGARIESTESPQNNEIIEKYCYDDNDSQCEEFGGLYHWDEMMQYIETEGIKGICPDGWHIPTDQEWKTLEGFTDSQYAIGDPVWNAEGGRGSDVGTNLKSQYIGVWEGGNYGNDKFGFRGLPSGCLWGQTFINRTSYGCFWTSTKYYSTGAWTRTISNINTVAVRSNNTRTLGYSVRCIRN